MLNVSARLEGAMSHDIISSSVKIFFKLLRKVFLRCENADFAINDKLSNFPSIKPPDVCLGVN